LVHLKLVQTSGQEKDINLQVSKQLLSPSQESLTCITLHIEAHVVRVGRASLENTHGLSKGQAFRRR